ncbi:threonylcarbamoyl-AMP synthase [bacterium]|nr:threonylcarbamoyl-AMP synthase [bacterium]
MKTLRLSTSTADLSRAAELLRGGRLVAFPTETVYGLGADATNDEAVRSIYAAKGRPSHNPTIIHVNHSSAAQRFAAAWPDAAERLTERFWPGPLTIVVPAGPDLSSAALAGGKTAGFRAPNHPAALELLAQCGRPIAAPSANVSGHLSPVDVDHVIHDLDGRIDAVIAGGPCRIGIESTVIDLSQDEPRILRPGMIDRAALESALGTAVAEGVADQQSELRSPGLLTKHYAPRIPLHIKSRDEMLTAATEVSRVFLDSVPTFSGDHSLVGILPADPARFASSLYRVLWECQASGAHEIWLERPPVTDDWTAIHDRLRRASATD